MGKRQIRWELDAITNHFGGIREMNPKPKSPHRKTVSAKKPDETAHNQQKLDQLMEAQSKALDEALRKGFFGKVTTRISIQDGSIQLTVCRVERTQR